MFLHKVTKSINLSTPEQSGFFIFYYKFCSLPVSLCILQFRYFMFLAIQMQNLLMFTDFKKKKKVYVAQQNMKGLSKACNMFSSGNRNQTATQTGSSQESARVVYIPYTTYQAVAATETILSLSTAQYCEMREKYHQIDIN